MHVHQGWIQEILVDDERYYVYACKAHANTIGLNQNCTHDFPPPLPRPRLISMPSRSITSSHSYHMGGLSNIYSYNHYITSGLLLGMVLLF